MDTILAAESIGVGLYGGVIRAVVTPVASGAPSALGAGVLTRAEA